MVGINYNGVACHAAGTTEPPFCDSLSQAITLGKQLEKVEEVEHDLSTLDETLKDLEDFQASLEAGLEGTGDEGGGEERGGGDGGEKQQGEGRTKRMMSLGEDDEGENYL